MTVSEALSDLFMSSYLSSRRELTAKMLPNMPQAVRDALASATSEEIGKVRLYDQRPATPRRVRPAVFKGLREA